MRKTALLTPLLLCLSLPARAADAILSAVTGKVTVKAAGAPAYEARRGDPIYFGDEVATGADGLAHLSFKDGAEVLVKPGSSLTLRGKAADRLMDFSLGEFLIGLKNKLAAGQRFRVKTPAAVAAVRGTLFWGLSDAAKATTYACFESEIEIAAQGKTLVLTPGQKVVVAYGQAPGEPASAADIPADYVDTFKVDGSLRGLETLMPAPAAPAPQEPAPAPEAPPAPAGQ